MPDSKPNPGRVALLKDRSVVLPSAVRACQGCFAKQKSEALLSHEEFFRDLLKPGYVNIRITDLKKKLAKKTSEAMAFSKP